MIYKLEEILNDIKFHLDKNLPFSLTRFGDGDIKLVRSILKRSPSFKKMSRSGIPMQKTEQILKIYKMSLNNSNYIPNFDVYFSDDFWSRSFSRGTEKRVRDWEDVYKEIGIINKNYCNPEIGFLLFLNEKNNLLDIIKDKTVCLVTSRKEVKVKFDRMKIKNKIILIPGKNSNHYSKFKTIKKNIINHSKTCDIFLIGAGVLGKAYTNLVKKNGKMGIDIGQVFETWGTNSMPIRNKGRIKLIGKKNLRFELTNKTRKFKKFI